jgi:hypothetical protein
MNSQLRYGKEGRDYVRGEMHLQQVMYEGYSKIKLRLAGKKNRNREQNFLIWNSYIPH